MKLSSALLCGLAAIPLLSRADVAGPYSYQGLGGGMDWQRWSYGPVRNDEVQQISFQLLTGGAALDPDLHWAFGLRGASAQRPCPVSDLPQFRNGCPLGRGLALGYFPDGFGSGGVCVGIAVEDFTAGYVGEQAVVAGTCVPFQIRPYQRYGIVISASADDVSWVLLEMGPTRSYNPATGSYEQVPGWTPVSRGGCKETAGVSCPELSDIDQDFGDVFVTSAFLNPRESWSVEDLYISRY